MIKRKDAKGSISFILSMAIITIWSSSNALEMSSVTFETKLFWANLQYFSYCYSPVTLLALCMEFTEHERLVRDKKILWFAVIPTIVFILAWTDRYHGLIRYEMYMDYGGAFPVIAKKYGPIFIVHAVYAQILNLSAWLLLLKAVISRKSVYRKQASSLLIALSLIVIPNILYILGLNLEKRFDWTPLLFGPAGLIAAWGIFRYKLFEVLPVAWATVVKTMNVGVMVLDFKGRILDINPYFEKIIGVNTEFAITKPVQEVCSNIPELVDGCLDQEAVRREFAKQNREFEVLLSPLKDKKGKKIGRLTLTYDITQKKKEQKAYLTKQWEIAIKTERERSARDLHDNLGQFLGFINLQAQGIKQDLINAGVTIVSDQLDKLVEAAQLANNDIREYIRNARNEASAEKDFMSSLEQNVLNFEEQTGIELMLEAPDAIVWDEIRLNTKLNVLSIIQEALNNIRRHAAAEKAKIDIRVSDGLLKISVTDDGNGFDPDSSCVKAGCGLNIMRERAAEIGAHFSVSSTAGSGSSVELEIPMEVAKSYESHAGR